MTSSERSNQSPSIEDDIDSVAKASFVKKLFDLVSNEDEEVVGFSADGSSFEVRDPKRLEAEVLPKYFRHSRFQSLVRQLNFYNFKKLSKERHAWVYHHKLFHRDQPMLLEGLKRKTNNGGEHRASAQIRSLFSKRSALQNPRPWQPPSDEGLQAPGSVWREVHDPSTGYIYFWNTATGHIQWDQPPDHEYYQHHPNYRVERSHSPLTHQFPHQQVQAGPPRFGFQTDEPSQRLGRKRMDSDYSCSEDSRDSTDESTSGSSSSFMKKTFSYGSDETIEDPSDYVLRPQRDSKRARLESQEEMQHSSFPFIPFSQQVAQEREITPATMANAADWVPTSGGSSYDMNAVLSTPTPQLLSSAVILSAASTIDSSSSIAYGERDEAVSLDSLYQQEQNGFAGLSSTEGCEEAANLVVLSNDSLTSLQRLLYERQTPPGVVALVTFALRTNPSQRPSLLLSLVHEKLDAHVELWEELKRYSEAMNPMNVCHWQQSDMCEDWFGGEGLTRPRSELAMMREFLGFVVTRVQVVIDDMDECFEDEHKDALSQSLKLWWLQACRYI